MLRNMEIDLYSSHYGEEIRKYCDAIVKIDNHKLIEESV